MANPTTNYSFAMPQNNDLVKDLPADFEVFGQAVDTQMKTNADAAIAKTIVDAKGDLIAATGADAVSRLAVGTNDQVLIADSTTATGLKWGTPSAGGMTLISETTASALSSLSLSSIPQTYKQLMLVWNGITHSNGTTGFELRFNNTSTTSYFVKMITNNGIGGVFNANTTVCASPYDDISAFGNNITGTGDPIIASSGTLLIDNYTSTSKMKVYTIDFGYYAGGNVWKNGTGVFSSLSAITSIDVLRPRGTGTFSNNTNTSIRLYGIS
jgi:hypothetical protein